LFGGLSVETSQNLCVRAKGTAFKGKLRSVESVLGETVFEFGPEFNAGFFIEYSLLEMSGRNVSVAGFGSGSQTFQCSSPRINRLCPVLTENGFIKRSSDTVKTNDM